MRYEIPAVAASSVFAKLNIVGAMAGDPIKQAEEMLAEGVGMSECASDSDRRQVDNAGPHGQREGIKTNKNIPHMMDL